MIAWGRAWHRRLIQHRWGDTIPAPTLGRLPVSPMRLLHEILTRQVWTGIEMIVWGRVRTPMELSSIPAADTTPRWTVGQNTQHHPMLPSARYLHTAVWTGSEMIVWGGYDGNNNVNTGARYNPGTNSWTANRYPPGAPSSRSEHTAVLERRGK